MAETSIGWIRQEARSIRVLLRAALKASLQYRFSFLSTMLGGVALQGIQLLFLGILLAQFGVIAGWGFDEVGLLFAIRLAAHAFYVVPFGNLFTMDWVVRDGHVDRMMIRPAHVWTQVAFGRFPLMALGDAVLGFGALAIFAIRAPVDWTPALVVYLLAAIIAGGLVEAGIQTFLCGLNFPLGNTQSIRIFADDMLTRFSGYPLTMFGRYGLISLTFLFPMAFIAFFPATVALGRVDEVPLPDWLIYGAPVAGPIVMAGGLAFFNYMTRFYSSPGN